MARTLARLCALTMALFTITAVAQAKPLNTLTYRECFAFSTALCGGQSSPALTGLVDVTATSDDRYVYTAAQGGLLGIFRRNPRTGALVAAGCVSGASGAGCGPGIPGFGDARRVVVSPDGRNAYAVNAGPRALFVFDRDTSTGALTKTACFEQVPSCGGTSLQSINTPVDVAISPDGRNVYVASIVDGSVATFSRSAATGALTPIGCIQDTGGGATDCPKVNALQGANSVTVSPDGASVYVTARQSNSVTSFSRDASTGALTRTGCVQHTGGALCPTTPGLDGVTDVAVSPDNASAYVTSETSDAVARFTRTPGATPLTAAGCVQATGGSGCGSTTNGLDGASSVVVGPDGQNVYVGGAQLGTFVTFDRTAGTGALSAPVCTNCTGTSPSVGMVSGLAITPDAGSLLVASSSNNTLGNWSRERPPVCLPVTTAAGGATAIALDCFDPNGTAADIEVVAGPSGGSLGTVDQGAGRVTYTPRAGFSGTDSFTYRANSDGNTGGAATATLVVPGPDAVTPPASPVMPPPTRDPLFAVLAQAKASVRRGRRATIGFAATRAGKATVRIKLKGRTVATLTRTLRRAGRSSVTWNGKVKGKKAARGTYRVELSYVATDRAKASDRASLKLTR